MQGCPCGAEPSGPRRQHVAPDGGDARAPPALPIAVAVLIRVSERTGNCQYGHLLEDLGQVVARRHDAPRGGVVGRLLGDGTLLGFDVRGVGAAVGLGDHHLLVGVVHHHPAPLLIVATSGCLGRNAHAIQHELAWHRPGEVESLPDRAGGREKKVGILQVDIAHGSF